MTRVEYDALLERRAVHYNVLFDAVTSVHSGKRKTGFRVYRERLEDETEDDLIAPQTATNAVLEFVERARRTYVTPGELPTLKGKTDDPGKLFRRAWAVFDPNHDLRELRARDKDPAYRFRAEAPVRWAIVRPLRP